MTADPKPPPGTVFISEHTGIHNSKYPGFSAYWHDKGRRDKIEVENITWHEYTGGGVHIMWRSVSPCGETGGIIRFTLEETAVTCLVCLDRIVERKS